MLWIFKLGDIFLLATTLFEILSLFLWKHCCARNTNTNISILDHLQYHWLSDLLCLHKSQQEEIVPWQELTVQLEQLTALVANLAMEVNNLTRAWGANPPPVAEKPAATVFVFTPSLAACNNFKNFNTKNGLALYKTDF